MPFENTVLALSGIGVPPYSARGLRQRLTPIGASTQLRRTINGTLRDFAGEQFRKYSSVIQGDDQQPPACDGVWPGRLVTVHCIAELAVADTETATALPSESSVPTDTSSTDTELPSEASESVLGRPAVPGSVRTETGFIFYRPILEMRVVGFDINRDEWGAQVGWSMDLEEV
jgi:hypothetical protein